MEEDYERTLLQCREVTPLTIRNEKRSIKIIGTLMRLIAPLL